VDLTQHMILSKADLSASSSEIKLFFISVNKLMILRIGDSFIVMAVAVSAVVVANVNPRMVKLFLILLKNQAPEACGWFWGY